MLSSTVTMQAPARGAARATEKVRDRVVIADKTEHLSFNFLFLNIIR